MFKINPSVFAPIEKKVYEERENIWLKLDAGKYQLRFLGPWSDEGTPFRYLKLHSGNMKIPATKLKDKDGKNRMPICLHTIFANDYPGASEALVNYLVEKRGKLEMESDFNQYKAKGCPVCKLANATIKAAGKDEANKPIKDLGFSFLGKRTFWFNVVDRRDGKVLVFSRGPEFFKVIETAFNNFSKVNIDIFSEEAGADFNLEITGSGEFKRYGSPDFILPPTPANYTGEKNSLDWAVLTPGYRSYGELVSMVQTNEVAQALISKFGIVID